MSSFLYFVPGLDKPASLEDAASAGVAYAFESKGRLQCAPINGRTPTGSPGMLLFDQQRLGAAPPGYRPDEQTWRKIPGSETWAGFYKEHRPTPESLARSEQLTGELLNLGDGQQWLAPQLKVFAGEQGFQPAYPLIADLDENGNWVSGGASPASAKMEKLFERLMDGMAGEGLSTNDGLDMACQLLAINYAIDRVEAAMLRLLETNETLGRILRVASDWDAAMEWAKKKTPTSDQTDSAG